MGGGWVGGGGRGNPVPIAPKLFKRRPAALLTYFLNLQADIIQSGAHLLICSWNSDRLIKRALDMPGYDACLCPLY